MTASPRKGRTTRNPSALSQSPLKIGGLAPLTQPGWVEAGRHLLAGLELGIADINRTTRGDICPLELIVRDTAGNAERATAAVDELHSLGVCALAGEYHSVAASAAAARADELKLPFLCSSAVLDALTDAPSDWVARLAPVQSQSWPVLADELADRGHQRAMILAEPGPYWSTGGRIFANALHKRGVGVTVVAASGLTPGTIGDRLLASGATVLVLLVGHPEPAIAIVRGLKSDFRIRDLTIAAPAGQPEFADWRAALGALGAGVPFLSYMPEKLGPLGAQVEKDLCLRLGEPPSFIAFEGYDTILTLSAALRSTNANKSVWADLRVEGTRGTICFSRVSGISVWQWVWPPVALVEHDPEQSSWKRVLRRG